MKTKYERLSKEEKKEVYNMYKKEKPELAKKIERMIVLCKVGIGLSIFMFIYDLLVKSKVNYIIDIILLIFCILVLLKSYNTRKNLLSDFVVDNDKKRKMKLIKNKK